MARPKKYTECDRLNICLEAEDKARLVKIAADRETSVSELLSKHVKAALEEAGLEGAESHA